MTYPGVTQNVLLCHRGYAMGASWARGPIPDKELYQKMLYGLGLAGADTMKLGICKVSDTLATFELIDERDVFVDCVRRVRFYSPAKIFIMDNFAYEVTLAGDDHCGVDPSQNSTDTDELTDSTSGAAGARPQWASAVAASACAAALLRWAFLRT